MSLSALSSLPLIEHRLQQAALAHRPDIICALVVEGGSEGEVGGGGGGNPYRRCPVALPNALHAIASIALPRLRPAATRQKEEVVMIIDERDRFLLRPLLVPPPPLPPAATATTSPSSPAAAPDESPSSSTYSSASNPSSPPTIHSPYVFDERGYRRTVCEAGRMLMGRIDRREVAVRFREESESDFDEDGDDGGNRDTMAEEERKKEDAAAVAAAEEESAWSNTRLDARDATERRDPLMRAMRASCETPIHCAIRHGHMGLAKAYLDAVMERGRRGQRHNDAAADDDDEGQSNADLAKRFFIDGLSEARQVSRTFGTIHRAICNGDPIRFGASARPRDRYFIPAVPLAPFGNLLNAAACNGDPNVIRAVHQFYATGCTSALTAAGAAAPVSTTHPAAPSASSSSSSPFIYFPDGHEGRILFTPLCFAASMHCPQAAKAILDLKITTANVSSDSGKRPLFRVLEKYLNGCTNVLHEYYHGSADYDSHLGARPNPRPTLSLSSHSPASASSSASPSTASSFSSLSSGRVIQLLSSSTSEDELELGSDYDEAGADSMIGNTTSPASANGNTTDSTATATAKRQSSHHQLKQWRREAVQTAQILSDYGADWLGPPQDSSSCYFAGVSEAQSSRTGGGAPIRTTAVNIAAELFFDGLGRSRDGGGIVRRVRQRGFFKAFLKSKQYQAFLTFYRSLSTSASPFPLLISYRTTQFHHHHHHTGGERPSSSSSPSSSSLCSPAPAPTPSTSLLSAAQASTPPPPPITVEALFEILLCAVRYSPTAGALQLIAEAFWFDIDERMYSAEQLSSIMPFTVDGHDDDRGPPPLPLSLLAPSLLHAAVDSAAQLVTSANVRCLLSMGASTELQRAPPAPKIKTKKSNKAPPFNTMTPLSDALRHHTAAVAATAAARRKMEGAGGGGGNTNGGNANPNRNRSLIRLQQYEECVAVEAALREAVQALLDCGAETEGLEEGGEMSLFPLT